MSGQERINLLEETDVENIALATSPINPPKSSSGPSSSDSSSSSSGEDDTVAKWSSSSKREKRKRRKNMKAKKSKTRKSVDYGATARVTMAPLTTQHPHKQIVKCNCKCKEHLKEVTISLIKIKRFLRQNYCSICFKAGHTADTCRRGRPRGPALDLD